MYNKRESHKKRARRKKLKNRRQENRIRGIERERERRRVGLLWAYSERNTIVRLDDNRCPIKKKNVIRLEWFFLTFSLARWLKSGPFCHIHIRIHTIQRQTGCHCIVLKLIIRVFSSFFLAFVCVCVCESVLFGLDQIELMMIDRLRHYCMLFTIRAAIFEPVQSFYDYIQFEINII